MLFDVTQTICVWLNLALAKKPIRIKQTTNRVRQRKQLFKKFIVFFLYVARKRDTRTYIRFANSSFIYAWVVVSFIFS